MAKVSVIIPIHNTEKYLEKCLESVVKQTYKNLEILCVDDCSTDSSSKILEKYASMDSRFRIIRIDDEAVGASKARNEALEIMTGDYVYFIDSDDWIDSDYIEKMVEAIEKSSSDIVMNRGIVEEINGKTNKYAYPQDKLYPINSFIDSKKAITDIFCSIWSKIYRKELFDKYNLRFPVNLKKSEDFYFQYISLIHTDNIYIISESNYHYLFRDNSLTTSQTNDKDIYHLRAFDRVFDYYQKNNLLDMGVKIFSVMPFFSVDSEEKYIEYKKYFEKAKDYLFSHSDIYNEMDLFFAKNILNTSGFTEYSQNFSKSVMMSYLQRNRIKLKG